MENKQIERINFLDLLQVLQTYKKVLDSPPTHKPRPGLYNQFEFYKSGETKKLFVFIDNNWEVFSNLWSDVIDDNEQKPEDGATNGADWDSNLINIPDRHTNTATNGLNLTNEYLGYYDGNSFQSYIRNNGNFQFRGDDNNEIVWNGSTLGITAGNISVIDNLTVSGLGITANDIYVTNNLNVTSEIKTNIWRSRSNTSKYMQHTSSGFECNDNFYVGGTLSKAAGSFVIDHPLKPETHKLQHSFVESPEMINIYKGNAYIKNGECEIEMPDWFIPLNGDNIDDFSYSLTSIGQKNDLWVKEEMNKKGKVVFGGEKDGKFSYIIYGVRHDEYAENNRIKVEVKK